MYTIMSYISSKRMALATRVYVYIMAGLFFYMCIYLALSEFACYPPYGKDIITEENVLKMFEMSEMVVSKNCTLNVCCLLIVCYL